MAYWANGSEGEQQERVRAGDWCRCRGYQSAGYVRRVARDGGWADVLWPWGPKRMATEVLVPVAIIDMMLGSDAPQAARESVREGVSG